MNLVLLLFFFFLANLFYIVMIWNNAYLDVVYPTFINSSEKINFHDEIESVFLKSAKKYIAKYFKKHQLPKLYCDYNNNFFKHNYKLKEVIGVTPSGKYNMFFNHNNKSELFIVSYDNSVLSTNFNKENTGKITLYKTNVENLITNRANSPDILTYKCWSNIVPGKILKVVFSSDKKVMSVQYRLVVRSSIIYRIRHFHNLECYEFKKSKLADKLDRQIENDIDKLINK